MMIEWADRQTGRQAKQLTAPSDHCHSPLCLYLCVCVPCFEDFRFSHLVEHAAHHLYDVDGRVEHGDEDETAEDGHVADQLEANAQLRRGHGRGGAGRGALSTGFSLQGSKLSLETRAHRHGCLGRIITAAGGGGARVVSLRVFVEPRHDLFLGQCLFAAVAGD